MKNKGTPHPLPPDRRRQLPVGDRRGLLMVGDTVAILVAVLLSLVIWVIVDGRGLGANFILRHSYWFPILAVLWLLLASANDFYNLRISSRLDTSLMRLAQVTLQLLVFYLVIFFFSPRSALPRLFILYYAVLSFVLIILWRACRPRLGGRLRRRALVIGAGHSAISIIKTLRKEAPNDYEIVGLIVEPGDTLPIDLPMPIPLIATGGDMLSIALSEGVSEVILAHDRDLSAVMFKAVLDCYEQGVSIVPMPVLYEQVTGRVPTEHVGQRFWINIMPTEGGSIFEAYPLIKRLMDVGLSLIGLVLFALLLPLIAVGMRLDSPGPLFFRQERVGQGGRVFRVLKLRSMILDAEAESGPQWARAGDPRITRLGRLLRRTRLDEVPQLVNVLAGDMSLIGPRPERPEFVAQLSERLPFYRTRHAVKPGITGWAQVRYRYGGSEEDALIKLQYDLYYIRHQSLVLDLLIMLRTAGKMLSLQGT